jgi:Alternative complex III, ActD subunit
MNSDAPRLYGILAEFSDPEQFVTGCTKVRDAGYRRWDAMTPFPIHGMDKAMGIRGTRLPLLILGGGLFGLAAALAMQYWMNAVDYPFLISGKPLFGLPAAIPVTFELTVLFSALTTFFGMWGLNGMPRLHHPLFNSEKFRRVTADRFFIVIEADDGKFDPGKTRQLLESLGPLSIENVED